MNRIISEVIIYIMASFAVLGAVDRIIGNRFGLGGKFEDGIKASGILVLSMVGLISLAPVIADILQPIVVPMFQILGADPAMFVGAILANDMGGASLAMELASDKDAGNFSGLIIGAMLGVTIVFTIPTVLGIVDKNYVEDVATGIMAGVVTVPIGAFAGGLVAGYSVQMICSNLFPILIFAVLIAIGLWKCNKIVIKGFIYFGKIVIAVTIVGLLAGIVEVLTGFVLFTGMKPIKEGFLVVADITIVLAGAFPMVHILTNMLKIPLIKIGGLLGINDTAAAGLVVSMANSVPMFGMIKDMDKKGVVINMAFAISASFVFGDHLGFTAGFDSEMILPMIVAKLVGGISAVLVAYFMICVRSVN